MYQPDARLPTWVGELVQRVLSQDRDRHRDDEAHGTDQNGEVFFSTFDGRILEFRRHHWSEADAPPFPKRLSETGLFSSMRAAKAAAEIMRERLDTPVLCQGEDTTSALVQQFADDAETSLFGTLSLWQGVDVPGPSLSLVLIDRIPFPRPDDPLLTARQRAVAARGGNGFMAVAASHAALLLAQGAGRLLRRIDDRGVVAVLDSRMATARYGGYLRVSLPPFWATTDSNRVRGALERLRKG